MAANVPPYGNAIQQARARGDIDEMRKVASEAEAFIAEHGDLPDALAELKAEIAKQEGGGKGGH